MLTSYLGRMRAQRFWGGIVGVLFAVVFGIRWDGSVHLGIGDGHPLADVLYCGLAGVVVGGLSAESFRLSEPRSTIVAASLEPRQLEVPAVRQRARLLAGVTCVWAMVQTVVWSRWTPLLVATAGLALAGIGEATHRAIETRRRPLLSDEALAVDRHLRRFAVLNSARLQLSAAYLTAGWVVSKSSWDFVPEALAPIQAATSVLIVFGCLFWSVRQLRRSAPRPPRSWKPPVTEGAAP